MKTEREIPKWRFWLVICRHTIPCDAIQNRRTGKDRRSSARYSGSKRWGGGQANWEKRAIEVRIEEKGTRRQNAASAEKKHGSLIGQPTEKSLVCIICDIVARQLISSISAWICLDHCRLITAMYCSLISNCQQNTQKGVKVTLSHWWFRMV